MEKKGYLALLISIVVAFVLVVTAGEARSGYKRIKLSMVGGLSESVLKDYHYFWLIEEVKGCIFNIIGVPVFKYLGILREFDYKFLHHSKE